MTNTTYAKLTSGLIAAWFAFSLAAPALHLFENAPNQPPLPLLLAVLTPIAIFTVWYFNSKSFRDFVLSLSPKTLTLVHTMRLAGFVFLALYTYRILPGILALPAGWGDIAIGATAVFAATRLANPGHRTAFIAWQFLGITDLVTAISLGASAGFLYPNGISTQPMAVLPMSLIPTFGVPLFLILHGIAIAQARRWPKDATSRVGAAGSLAV
jgi:hypothetical protein